MAEIHVIGQILSAHNFPKQSLFCKWNLQYGNNWKVISGSNEGQTQVDTYVFNKDVCYWHYPLDVHFAAKGIQGWPKVHVQVFHLDWVGRVHLYGYGYITIPTSSGSHTLDCYTWRPLGSLRERISQYFLGGSPQLKYPDLVYSSLERYKLNTETMGIIKFEINVILRNFDKFGVEYSRVN